MPDQLNKAEVTIDITSLRETVENRIKEDESELRRRACAITRDYGATADLIQDLRRKVLKLIQNEPERLPGNPIDLIKYLRKAMKNLAIDWWRRRSQTCSSPAPQDHPNVLATHVTVDGDSGVDVAAIDLRLRRSFVALHCDRLSGKRRAVIKMRSQNMSFRHIAAKLNISRKTAEKHYQLAVEDLRKMAEEEKFT